MTKTFTASQMEALSKYEKNLERAATAKWWSAMAERELKEIHDIAVTTGYNIPFKSTCSVCVGELLEHVGRLYLAQRAETPQISTHSEKVVNVPSSPTKARKTKNSKK